MNMYGTSKVIIVDGRSDIIFAITVTMTPYHYYYTIIIYYFCGGS